MFAFNIKRIQLVAFEGYRAVYHVYFNDGSDYIKQAKP
jgi:hypothetical protein